MGDYRVRPPLLDDYVQWLRLWQEYNAFYDRAGPTALPREVNEATWSRFFDPETPMHAFVAQRAGELVGLVHFLFHPSTSSIASVCYLQDVFTAPAARGEGVATALIERVRQEAEQAGASRLYWQTHEGNAVARRLYDAIADRSGFIVYRIVLPT